MQLNRHLQTFLHRNTQRLQRKWVYTKKALHSLGTHCVRRTNTSSSSGSAPNQPATVGPQLPGHAGQTPDTERAAISRAPCQHFFIWLPLEACTITLLREDCLVFNAMHFHVPIIQLYIYCIRHRNWSPFPFFILPLILVVIVYACVCLYLFFVHYIYIYIHKGLIFKFRVFYKFPV